MNFILPEGCNGSWICSDYRGRESQWSVPEGDITFNTTIANMKHYKSGIALSHDKWYVQRLKKSNHAYKMYGTG